MIQPIMRVFAYCKLGLVGVAFLWMGNVLAQTEKVPYPVPDANGVYPKYGQYTNFKPPKPLNLEEVSKKIGYPLAARAKGIEGEALLMVLVDEKGHYRKHVYTNTPHIFLKQAINQDIKRLKFEPATTNGKRMKFWVKVPFRFKMN